MALATLRTSPNRPCADPRPLRVAALTGLLLLVILVSFSAGVIAAPYLTPRAAAEALAAPAPPSGLEQQLGPLWQAWGLVEERFVFKQNVDRQKMVYGAIQGMLATLDDEGHTRFLSPAELKAQRSSLEGHFEGIGAEMTTRDGRPTVVAPIEGSPAERAGLRAGDVVVRVDGADVSGLSLTDLVSRVRGPKGTTVRLGVLHPGETTVTEISIVRDQISVQTVTWAMAPGTTVAHIQIGQFGAAADAELRQAVQDARAAGATGLVVDVRNNPGGLLDQAIAVASEFQDQGLVLLEEDRAGRRRPYPVQKGGLALDLPVVVLTNEGSASAAEIFAGAMQDNGRARIVGGTTFGTGTVLTPFQLGDGSAILLGTSQWLTPAGRAIRKQGIRPDVPVALPSGTERLSPRAERAMSAGELERSGDQQLLTALDLVRTGQAAPPAGRTGQGGRAQAY